MKIFGIALVIVIIIFILRLTGGRKKVCGPKCQPPEISQPKKRLTPKERRKEAQKRKEEIRKRIERIQTDEKRRKEKGEPIKLDWLENYGKKKKEEEKK